MSEKESSDFFNLNSDTDSENEKEDKIQETMQKWDWTAAENRDRFFDQSQPNRSLKRQQASTSESPSVLKRFKETDLRSQTAKLRPCIDIAKDDSKLVCTLNGHSSSVNRIHWSKCSNNKNMLLSSSMDSKIFIWDLNESKLTENKVAVYAGVHSKAIRNAIWFNVESEIASVSFDQTAATTCVSTRKETNRIEFKHFVSAITSHPTESSIALIGGKNEVYAWDTRVNKIIKTYKSLMGQVQDIIFINENEFAVCGDVVSKESAQHSIMIWDFKSTAVISDQIFHEKFIPTCLKKHPFSSSFYAQTHGNYVAEFAARPPFKMNKHKRFESRNHVVNGYSIGFDVNKYGSLLASGSSTGHVLIYNLQSSKLLESLNVFASAMPPVPCMDAKFNNFSDQGGEKCLLAVSGWNGMIKVYDI